MPRTNEGGKPRGEFVGTADEYGTIWSAAPGTSRIVGDLVHDEDFETVLVYLEQPDRDAAVTLIERIANGSYGGFNDAVLAAQEFLTERTQRLVAERDTRA
jgi:hypothetical protein